MVQLTKRGLLVPFAVMTLVTITIDLSHDSGLNCQFALTAHFWRVTVGFLAVQKSNRDANYVIPTRVKHAREELIIRQILVRRIIRQLNEKRIFSHLTCLFSSVKVKMMNKQLKIHK